jgi:hypothetical protein
MIMYENRASFFNFVMQNLKYWGNLKNGSTSNFVFQYLIILTKIANYQ